MPAKVLNGMAELYFKPSLGKFVVRKPGITRTERWKQNVAPRTQVFAEKMTGKAIASACKGKKWDEFVACLRREGRKAWHG